MIGSPLEHSLTRAVVIHARRATVFSFFTDSARFAAWWGAGSAIDPHPGGAVRICYPGGVVASGAILEIDAPARIVFSYGYEDPGKPFGPGASRVSITLEEIAAGTRVTLRHDLPDAASRDEHRAGWRFQLSLFANVVTRQAHAGIATTLDRFFAAWSARDAPARRAALAGTVTPDVAFRDPFATVDGIDDLDAHIQASQVHMPDMTLQRAGEPRECQGTVLVPWQAVGPDGAPRRTGSNVVTLDPDGRIAACVGFWNR